MAPAFDNGLSEFSYRTRINDWNHLKNNSNQLLHVVVVGGGIVGAGVLRELSLRGIQKCFLFEKNDYASGTSGVSSKLIHAGIRYLEQAWDRLKKGRFKEAWQNFKFVLQASRERHTLGEMAPHLVKPKPIYLLIGESNSRSVFSVFLGIWFYYVIQILQGQFFRPPKIVFRKTALQWIAPRIDPKKVKALFSFWDSETDDARLVIETLQNAHEWGGHALNYVELIEFRRCDEGFELKLKNHVNNDSLKIKTKILINATGPFVEEVANREKGGGSENRPKLDRVAGSHINIYPALTDESYYVTAGDRRLVFVLRREEDGFVYTRIGTTERSLQKEESSDHPEPTEEEIRYLFRLVKDFFPHAVITEESIVSMDAGIRPLRSQECLDTFQKSREHDILEDRGLFHVLGVKLTDYRRVSRELMNQIDFKKVQIDVPKPEIDSGIMALRMSSHASLYEEASLEESIRRTMIVHWDDYVLRRKGLLPLIWAKSDPQKLYNEFERFVEIMQLERSEIEFERNRMRETQKRGPTPGGIRT